MITLLLGENSFEIDSALNAIIDGFDGKVERIKADDLQISQLPDILMGISLFATKRLVVIRGLSENKTIWPVLGDWLSKVSDDIHLILIETKIDKRSATYKALKSAVDVREFLPWPDRDIFKAEKWTVDQAKNMGVALDNKLAQFLVRRVGADEWQLFHALEKLALVDSISEEVIKDIVEPNLTENVFELFDTAIKGDLRLLKDMLRILEQTEDIYRLSALLYSQAFQLAAIAAADKDDDVAKDFGIHPFVVSKLESVAKRVGKTGVAKIVKIFAQADEDTKISKADPWILLERALMKIANL